MGQCHCGQIAAAPTAETILGRSLHHCISRLLDTSQWLQCMSHRVQQCGTSPCTMPWLHSRIQLSSGKHDSVVQRCEGSC